MNDKIKYISEKNRKQGSDIFVEILEKIGVDIIFHYPGGTMLDINQSVNKSSKIRTVVSRNEQGSGFSAVGAAQASGLTQVAMGISGPGSTNLMTPIGDAFLDSVPVVFIAGQVHQGLIGNMAFQEFDFNATVKPIVKKEFLIKKASDIPNIINEAFKIANSGRPGPVAVVIPKDVQQEVSEYEIPQKISSLEYQKDNNDNEKNIDNKINEIKKLLSLSKKPLIYAGGGIITSNASENLRKFAIKNNIPVTTTLKGLGSFDENHKLSLGMIGMHGMYYTNKAVAECDLLFAFGVRFDDRVASDIEKFAPKAKIVHVDIDKKEINKNKKIDVGVNYDIDNFLERINQEEILNKDSNKDWIEEIEKWKLKQNNKTPKRELKDKENIIAGDVFEILNDINNGNNYIVTSVGKHQMHAAQKYKFKFPRQMITSGGFGTMGFGLPASIGVELKKKYKEMPTIVITGDGSFQMNIQELATISAEKLKQKIIIFNDYKLGMVAQWEDKFYNKNYADTDFKQIEDKHVDFCKLAEAYNIKSSRVSKKSELKEEILKMMNSDSAYILDIEMVEEDHAVPMIPSGKNVDDTIF